MNEIFFLLFAFFTVFLSVKISYYADSLSKRNDISKALIGGIVLAGVTSLPEFVTCFSAIFVGNYNLAMGDILGSNIFNFFMICVFDLIFFKKMFFYNTSQSHNLTFSLLLINYIFLLLFGIGILGFSILSIGIPTIVIFITYMLYIKSISKYEENVVINDYNDNYLVLKLVVASSLMILSSIILTILVNNLSIAHSSFSSSFLGAIFLGVTTSLPEVVTFYTLVCVKNYDLALSNIAGSNMFNLLVLGIGDLFIFKQTIYSSFDKEALFIVILGLIFSIILILSNKRNNNLFSFKYPIYSIIIILLYLCFWLFNLIF